MIGQSNRRQVLKAALGGLAVLALPPLASARAAQLQTLGDGFSLLDIEGSNVLVLSTEEGLVLVDSGPAAGVDALSEALASLGGQVHSLFNTHWHDDQCGGNALLGGAGARIVAHEKTRLWLSTDLYVPPEEGYRRALPEAARPVDTFFSGGSRRIGEAEIEYGYLRQAHTDGDIYLRFPAANLIAVGDVVSPLRDPEHDWYGGGWLGGRVDAMDQLLALCDDATRLVPAYGPVVGKAELQAERDMMATLYQRMVDQVRQGMSARDMLEEDIMAGIGREFRDPYKFLYDAHKGLWAHHNKLAPNIV